MNAALEYNIGKKNRQGSIEVICGSMFSGKTEELIRRIKRAQIAKQNVKIFKPSIDLRYAEHHVVSHDKTSLPAIPINASSELLELTTDDIDVIGIDEAQFFDNHTAQMCTTLSNKGIRIIIAGLDMDFKGQPFGPMPELCAVADCVTKVHAICMKCGMPAVFSHRLVSNNEQVLLGETQTYEPLCRRCFCEIVE